MKVTVYFKNGAFIQNEIEIYQWNGLISSLQDHSVIVFKKPDCIIKASEITHIIAQQPNQTENT